MRLQFKTESEISMHHRQSFHELQKNKLHTKQKAQMSSFLDIVAADVTSLRYNTKQQRSNQYKLNLALKIAFC